ncbi:MAG: c-type cytochrome [Cyanobacteria bacterium]|nr:c-type cytochrome [Cyanobacteriota bacterium]
MNWKPSLALVILLLVGWTSVPACKSQGKEPGRRVVDKNGCLNCHYIQGDGGLLGPPLDGVGGYRQKEYIVKLLSDPKKMEPITTRYPRPEQLMHHVRLPRKDALAVADYLISLPESDLETSHGASLEDMLPKGFKFTPADPSPSSRKGQVLFEKSGCLACHSLQNAKRLGPDLNGVGGVRSRSFIENRIARGAIVMHGGTEYKPSSYSMPPQKLSAQQIKQITDFLLTLPEN